MVRKGAPFIQTILLRGGLFAVAPFIVGCGSAQDSSSDPLGGTTSEVTEDCVVPGRLVPAEQVEVIGDLSADDLAVVSWALGRFDRLDLELTTPILVRFDSSRELCGGQPGRCLLFSDASAELFVCEYDGDSAARLADKRLTVLHELAHVWHWAQGEGAGWLDLSSIVGGDPIGPEVAWDDRTVERVADVISWGLMDTEWRAPRGDIPCRDMYQQFVALTGFEPLPPINKACVPDGGDAD